MLEHANEILPSFENTESLVQKSARQIPNVFIEYVGKDHKGRKVSQGDIHLEIQEHIRLCKEHGHQNIGILAPWGHGKTEQVIFHVLDAIGQDVNKRIQYICNTDDNATSRVVSVKRYIESDIDYHKIYPHVVPSPGDDWGKHKIVVTRDSKAKDGTLESWGITSSGTGSRADIQLFDDPVDMRNAILNPAMRQQVKDSFTNVWLPRLVSDGYRIYIATMWHTMDLTCDLLKNAEWKFLIMKVSEDFTKIECESPFKGKYSISLWEPFWNTEKLKKQLRLIGSRSFERGYRQKAYSDEERMFPSSDMIFRKDVDRSVVMPDWPRVMGVDPFGQKVVIFQIAIHPTTYQRYPYKIWRGEWKPKETIRLMKRIQEEDQPRLWVVENNASQVAIVEWAQEVGGSEMVILPFTTGRQKADPVMGLPSLDVEFANGSWVVPMAGVDPTDSENTFNIWRDELSVFPMGEKADTVMAMWFAREGVRFLTREKTEADYPPETITAEEDFEMERVQIGAY